MGHYTYWENALEGEIGSFSDGDCHCGFWRLRTAESSGKRLAAKFVGAQAVAIWLQDGEYVASVDGMIHDNPAELFMHVCKCPVPEEWFRARREGKEWPDVALLEKK